MSATLSMMEAIFGRQSTGAGSEIPNPGVHTYDPTQHMPDPPPSPAVLSSGQRVARPGQYVFPLRAQDGNQGCTIYCTVDANGKIDCTMHCPSGQTIAGSPRMQT